nr:hypothetical protein [Leekyejoonella antrihumi]
MPRRWWPQRWYRHQLTFAEFSRTWMADRPLKPRTCDGYTHLVSRYLPPAFGDTAITAITPRIVRKCWPGLDQATPTVNAPAYALLKAVLTPSPSSLRRR